MRPIVLKMVQDTLDQRKNTRLNAQHLTNTIMSAINPYIRELVQEYINSQKEKNHQRQIHNEAERRVKQARGIVDSIAAKIKLDPRINEKVRVIVARTRGDLLNSPDTLIKSITGKQKVFFHFLKSTRQSFMNHFYSPIEIQYP